MCDKKDIKERIKNAIEPATGSVLDMASGLLLDGTVGVVVPGVGNMILSYKQKRMENNIEKALSKLVERQDELNEKLEKIDGEAAREVETKYFDMMIDYATEAKQQEKIDFIVNGFINVCDIENPQEDIIMHYYDTLDEMTLLDIRILKLYYQPTYLGQEENESGDSFFKLINDCHLEDNEFTSIKEKLQRLGLVESRNEIDRENNIEAIERYLSGKDKKLKTKRTRRSDSFRITSYGRRFVDFFIEKNV